MRGATPGSTQFASTIIRKRLIPGCRFRPQLLPEALDARFAVRHPFAMLGFGLHFLSSSFRSGVSCPLLTNRDAQVGLKLALSCQLAECMQKTQFVIHRPHALCLGTNPAFQFIQDGLALSGCQYAEVMRNDVTMIL